MQLHLFLVQPFKKIIYGPKEYLCINFSIVSRQLNSIFYLTKNLVKILVLKVCLTFNHADVGRKEDVQVSHISAVQTYSEGMVTEFLHGC